MKSISIVYKKSNHQLPQDNLLTSLRIRRSVDQYYSKLIEKASQKKDQQNQRKQSISSSLIRPKTKSKFTSSLNIVKIVNPNSPEELTQYKQKNINPFKTQSVKRLPEQQLKFSFKAPSHNNYLVDLAGHRQEKILASKLKSLLQLPHSNKKQTVVVLSAQFILNQYNFWNQEQIDEQAVKTWKAIQGIANIIWLVRRQSSMKKILAFNKNNGLNPDGVYLVIPKKNAKTLLISYLSLEKDLQIDKNRKIIIINSLRVNNLNDLHYSVFFSLVPHIKHAETYIHFLKIDISDKTRFANVLKILSRNLPTPKSLNEYFIAFNKNQLQKISKFERKHHYERVTNEFMLEKVQSMKKNLGVYFGRVVGLRKTEGQQSTPYLVGDALKRNFNIFKQVYNQERLAQSYKEQQQIKNEMKMLSKPFSQVKYNRPVYFWQF